MFRMFRDIVRMDGFRGLYRGLIPSVLGSYPGQAIYYSSYEISKGYFHNAFHIDNYRGSTWFPAMEFVATGAAGLVSELASALFFVPSDNVTQRLQVHNVEGMPKFHGISDVVRTILKYEGTRGLFRGYKATIYTCAPGSVIWWAAYEVGKDAIHTYFDKRSKLSAKFFGAKQEFKDVSVHMISGAFAGFACCLVTNPLDVAKTRLQVLDARQSEHRLRIKNGIWPMMSDIMRKEGIRGLYRGIAARLIVCIPGSAISFVAYEFAKKMSLKPAPLRDAEEKTREALAMMTLTEQAALKLTMKTAASTASADDS